MILGILLQEYAQKFIRLTGNKHRLQRNLLKHTVAEGMQCNTECKNKLAYFISFSKEKNKLKNYQTFLYIFLHSTVITISDFFFTAGGGGGSDGTG